VSVSAEVFEIKSIKAFQQWLAENRQNAERWYVARHPCRSKCLLLSPNSSYDFQWDPWVLQKRPLHETSLPAINDAREWWFQFWEGEILTCHLLQDVNLIVLAKQAIWSAIPETHMDWPKAKFIEIDFAHAKGSLESVDVSTMQAEVQCCGIATRILRVQQGETLRQQLVLKQK
jgi:hypothetical protein